MMTVTSTLARYDKNPALLLFIIICAAAILRIYMISLDINILLDQGLIQDDAFYYFVIARNILQHNVSSFDGINLTNGYHPLWQAICLPVFYFWQGDSALRIMLGIACIFDLASIVLVFKILQLIVKSHHVPLIGASILALHGTIIRTWFNGLETAISVFSLLWLLYHFIKIQNKGGGNTRDHLKLGFIAAFAFLARTDNAIIITIMFACMYIPPLLQGKTRLGITASTVLLVLVSPWLAWNLVHFDSIVQVSGKIRNNTWLVNGGPAELPIYIDIVYGVLSSVSPVGNVIKKMFVPFVAPDYTGYIFLIPLLLVIVIAKRKSQDFSNQLDRILPFTCGVVVLFLYHTAVRHFVRGWYNAPVLIVITLLICLLIEYIFTINNSEKTGKKIQLFFPAMVILLILFYSPYQYTKTPTDLHEDPRISAANWINKNLATDAIIGSANAGILGYYTERPVVNLDGVVNESAFHARVENRLHQYIAESPITHLADHKGALTGLCATNDYFNCTKENSWDDATFVMRVNRHSNQ